MVMDESSRKLKKRFTCIIVASLLVLTVFSFFFISIVVADPTYTDADEDSNTRIKNPPVNPDRPKDLDGMDKMVIDGGIELLDGPEDDDDIVIIDGPEDDDDIVIIDGPEDDDDIVIIDGPEDNDDIGQIDGPEDNDDIGQIDGPEDNDDIVIIDGPEDNDDIGQVDGPGDDYEYYDNSDDDIDVDDEDDEEEQEDDEDTDDNAKEEQEQIKEDINEEESNQKEPTLTSLADTENKGKGGSVFYVFYGMSDSDEVKNNGQITTGDVSIDVFLTIIIGLIALLLILIKLKLIYKVEEETIKKLTIPEATTVFQIIE